MTERVLLIGASGSIGSHALPALLTDYQVTVLIRNPDKLPEDIKPKVIVVKGDLSDKEALIESLKGVTIVLFAAPTGNNAEENNEALKIITESLKKNSTKEKPAIFLMTSGLYTGGLSEDHNEEIGEENPGKLKSPWDKSAFENRLIGFKDELLEVSILRPAWVYGANSFVDKWLDAAKKQGSVAHLPDRDAWVSFIHISDLVDLFIIILKQRATGIYNVSEGSLNAKDFVDEVAKIIGGSLRELKDSDEFAKEGINFGFAMRKDFSLRSVSQKAPKLGWKAKHSFIKFVQDNYGNQA